MGSPWQGRRHHGDSGLSPWVCTWKIFNHPSQPLPPCTSGARLWFWNVLYERQVCIIFTLVTFIRKGPGLQLPEGSPALWEGQRGPQVLAKGQSLMIRPGMEGIRGALLGEPAVPGGASHGG